MGTQQQRLKGKSVFQAIAWATLLSSLFAFLNSWSQFAEYLVSFRPQLFVISALLPGCGIVVKSKLASWILLLALIINGLVIAPYYWPSSVAAESNLSIMTYNADKHRLPYTGVGEVVALVNSAESDVVVLLEIGEEQSAEIQHQLSDSYPYRFAHQDAAHDGVLLLSQIPLENTRALSIGGGRQTVTADLQFGDGERLHLVAPHPTNAWHGFDERNSQLQGLADYAKDAPRPLAIVGDLNVTMWSSWYQQIEQQGMRNVRAGRGVMASWLAPLPIQLPIWKLPLDHVLVSGGIGVFSAELLPSPGSDHQPLLTFLLIDP